MNQLITNISWNLNSFCTAECSYCPMQLRGGELPRSIVDYVNVAEKIINHFQKLNRKIYWRFSGGEPLDMFDFPMLLKLCKNNNGNVELTTNGGKLWMDWWAIEPHIDSLHLSYHYWQNFNLIKYIVGVFQKNNKTIEVIVPIRPDYFDEDILRAIEIENTFNITTSKAILYNNADQIGGMFPYTEQQLRIVRGEELVQEKIYFEKTTFQERLQETLATNPSFIGKFCNVGIESLTISHDGWASGSSCGNTFLGNIWTDSFELPTQPQICKMISCVNDEDQKITKFI